MAVSIENGRPVGDASQERQAQINAAGQQIYGSAWTPEMASEAWGNYQASGANVSDPQAYENQNFANFLYKFKAEPGAMGQANASAYATMQSDKNNEQLAGRMAPGSTLYNQYFGDNGVVNSQYKAFQTGLQPQQDLTQQRLGESLAARGLSNSGALQAGMEQNNKDYSQVLAQALQSMQATGQQNLTNQATSQQNYTQAQQQAGMTDVSNSIAQAEQQKQATEYQNQMQKANGWSWLSPVMEVGGAVASMIPGGQAIGAGLMAGGQAIGGKTVTAPQQQKQQTPGYGQGQVAGTAGGTYDPNLGIYR